MHHLVGACVPRDLLHLFEEGVELEVVQPGLEPNALLLEFLLRAWSVLGSPGTPIEVLGAVDQNRHLDTLRRSCERSRSLAL